jgi:hypothetical protein
MQIDMADVRIQTKKRSRQRINVGTGVLSKTRRSSFEAPINGSDALFDAFTATDVSLSILCLFAYADFVRPRPSGGNDVLVSHNKPKIRQLVVLETAAFILHTILSRRFNVVMSPLDGVVKN